MGVGVEVLDMVYSIARSILTAALATRGGEGLVLLAVQHYTILNVPYQRGLYFYK